MLSVSFVCMLSVSVICVYHPLCSQGAWSSKVESVENFICHNGDLDAFEIAEVTTSTTSTLPVLYQYCRYSTTTIITLLVLMVL